MTFASDTARMLFHQLPTSQQSDYAEWEKRLSQKNQLLQIEAVMNYGTVSEVVIRLTENIEALILPQMK